MDIWLLVVSLLALAVLFLLISLFTKDSTTDSLEDKLDSYAIQQSQELNNIKNRLGDIEAILGQDIDPQASYVDQDNGEGYVPQDPDSTYSQDLDSTGEESYGPRPDSDSQNSGAFSDPVGPEDLDEAIKEEIIRLYTQGYTMSEIASQVHLNRLTVQELIDDYIENR